MHDNESKQPVLLTRCRVNENRSLRLKKGVGGDGSRKHRMVPERTVPTDTHGQAGRGDLHPQLGKKFSWQRKYRASGTKGVFGGLDPQGPVPNEGPAVSRALPETAFFPDMALAQLPIRHAREMGTGPVGSSPRLGDRPEVFSARTLLFP